MIGRTISHYRILSQLGEGSMGVVYKAEDTNLRRPVAIKFIHPKAAVQTEVRERFRREAQAAAVIDHPNVCQVHHFHENGDQLFIVMTFIDGCSLRELIDSGDVPPSNAVDIAIQIAQGLRAAHQKGVTHRDLKPGNIMISTDNEVKITDFGLAYLADRSRLTAPGTIMGTFAYMSPEQAQAKPVDRRSDLWSLGCLIYEMITGKPPFVDTRGQTDLRRVVSAEPELKALGKISPDLQHIVKKLLQKDPSMRYQHGDDVVVDLRMVLRQLPAPGPLHLGQGLTSAQDVTVVAGAPTVASHVVEKRFPVTLVVAILLTIAAAVLLWMFVLRG